MKFNFKGNKLTFEFENEEAANHFKVWLCEQGEQDYWTWMECREQEEEGPITGTHFNYHSDAPTIIKVGCGRLRDNE